MMHSLELQVIPTFIPTYLELQVIPTHTHSLFKSGLPLCSVTPRPIPGAAGKHQVTPADSTAADWSQGNGIQMWQHLGRTATWGMGLEGQLIPLVFETDTDAVAPKSPFPFFRLPSQPRWS